jgi:Fibronectin type III domain
MALSAAVLAHDEHEDRINPADLPAEQTPDWAERPGAVPSVSTIVPAAFGPVAPAARQPVGALSGRIVFMNTGHGWTWDPNYWRLQRGTLQEMNEDYGNLDQLNFFAAYCFNAGATVVSMRPLGQQTNEVVLDNDDAGVVFAGVWFDSTSTYFFGSAGDLPYRYAGLAATETATATYTPDIPVEGYYPVYTWVRAGSDRGDQLYRIRHTGGETQIRIPHHMVGNGWIYLGEYWFNSGANSAAGSVVVSNLRGSDAGTYSFADAIRFGNGMGSVDRGTGVSGYPREEENCRYWIQAGLGQGQSTSLYNGSGDDENDSWSAPGKMSAEMNRQEEGSLYKRIHISFHSNAGGGRGTMALITSDPTPNQATLAQIAGNEVDEDLVALGSPPLELPWSNRSTVTYTGGYGEITGSYFNYEMDATIIEVAFHDNASDAALMRDPKARAAVGKASMHAVVRYMNQFDSAPLEFLPEPPANVRAHGASDSSIRLYWDAPVSSGGSGAPTGYVIYRSANGYGFGNAITVSNVTTHKITGLAAGVDYYFRVSAINAGGESMPSEVVGCRAPGVVAVPRVLVVNAFDRFDRTTNLRQNTTRQAWGPPDATGTIERVLPRRVNSFDYVVPHGKAISAYGLPFDSCQNEAVVSGKVSLGDYRIVIWACGQETTVSETFGAAEQAAVGNFRNAGGHLFVSGSEIAWDLDRASGPTVSDRVFFNNHLKADLASDANDNSGSYTTASTVGGIFSARGGAAFDDGSRGIYWVKTPDVLTPLGAGTSAALNYTGNPNGAAAIQYDGSAGGGKVVYFGFPFETITSATLRQQYMADILTFFTAGTATLVGVGSVWNYDDSGANLGTAWREVNFNDGAWSSGPAQLGFGDDDEATLVNTNRTRITTYFRRAFPLATTGELATVTLRVKRDDGVVVHLNGVEVFRNNLPTGPITSTTQAVIASGGTDESAWFTTNVSAGLLIAGTNMIAAEVHQNGTNSSDLSFDLELLAALRPPVPVTLIANGARWLYLDNGVNLGVSWRSNNYSDSAWKSGVGKLGFGGDGEVTLLNRTNANGTTNITFYFRNQFYLPNPLAVQALMARMIRDDGVVVYLNGAEVWRDSMPAGAISYTTPASATIGGADETTWITNGLNPSALIAGWNVLAAELHQSANTSSDAGFNFELSVSVSVPPPPSLEITPSALSWTAEAAFVTVYSATSLSPPVGWVVVTNAPVLMNGRWTIPLPPPTGDRRFFRLQSP